MYKGLHNFSCIRIHGDSSHTVPLLIPDPAGRPPHPPPEADLPYHHEAK
jgi:hypothetical protein